MKPSYDGAALLDDTGEQIGTVSRTYVDDNDTPRFLDVKIGSIIGRHHLVPADGADVTPDGVRIPYVKDVIEESPAVSGDDTLEGDELSRVREYYAQDFGGTPDDAVNESPQSPDAQADDGGAATAGATPTGTEPVAAVEAASQDERNRPPNDFGDATQEDSTDLGAIRDLGDVIEVPIVEEILVKKPVVREVLRIRKSELTEQGVAGADLRKETVEVVSSNPDLVGDVSADDGA